MLNPPVNRPFPSQNGQPVLLSPQPRPQQMIVIGQPQPRIISSSASRTNLGPSQVNIGASPNRINMSHSPSKPVDVNLNINLNENGTVSANTHNSQMNFQPQRFPDPFQNQGIPMGAFYGPPPRNQNPQPVMMDARIMNGNQGPFYPFMLPNGSPMPMQGPMYFPPSSYQPLRRGVPRRTKM